MILYYYTEQVPTKHELKLIYQKTLKMKKFDTPYQTSKSTYLKQLTEVWKKKNLYIIAKV